MQAVHASDYALGRFRFLSNLVLVHGRANYRRLCNVVLYSFYKNLVSQWISFLFSWENLFTGTALFETLLGTGFNVAFTFLPIIIYGIWDEDLPAWIVKRCGFLYSVGQRDGHFNEDLMIRNMIWATLHGFCIYYFTKYSFYNIYDDSMDTYGDVQSKDGRSSSMYAFGTVVYGVMILLLNARVAARSYTWSLSLLGALGLSIFLYFLFVITHSSYYALWKPIAFGYDYFGIGIHLFGSARYWLILIGISVASLLPDMIVTSFQKEFFELPKVEILTEVAANAPERLEEVIQGLNDGEGTNESYSTGLEKLGKLVKTRQSSGNSSRDGRDHYSSAISTGHRRLMDRLLELQSVIAASNKSRGGKGLQASSMKSHSSTYMDLATLKFSHDMSTLEKDYVRRYIRKNTPVMRNLFFCFIIFFGAGFVQKVLAALGSDHILKQVLRIEFIFTLFLFLTAPGAYFMTYLPMFQQHYQMMTLFTIFAMSAFQTIVIDHNGFAGSIMITSFTLLCVRIRFLVAISIAAFSVGFFCFLYVSMCVYADQDEMCSNRLLLLQPYIWGNFFYIHDLNIFHYFLICTITILLGAGCAYSLERNMRQEFLFNKDLKKAKAVSVSLMYACVLCYLCFLHTLSFPSLARVPFDSSLK